MKLFGYSLSLLVLFFGYNGKAQSKKSSTPNPVYVDAKGVLRWTATKKEAAFFGVNYTVPFAYGYRSHKVLGVDIEKAIDQDVYHFVRLGLDAFRVHVWDTEISDSTGNLKENDHLRLYDYLLWKLKERHIKVIITPIAFWGNGYPEKDERTGSFVDKYGKGQAVVNEEAFKAQEKYLNQFFTHVNPYTRLTYANDDNVLAVEINNEPHHSGPKARTTEYINRMAQAIRGTHFTKPVFYNISESPAYADAVAKANVDGFSFQWYPTGLVAGRTLIGNYLPNVDAYKIPFGDTIPAFFGKARLVYEFDAGDVFQSNMYPSMAKSFRAAGFQWATQFAYDPLATAYANTEYQTHYLNLAYTPSKAISLLIASKAFHTLPLNKSYGTYPADSVFDNFRVSYKNELSEMNTEEEFYHSNSTQTQPKNIGTLKHIAAVGSSPVVNYQGYGAYFLDKLAEGKWRLEVMPDAIQISDPFAKASLQKTVTTIQYASQPITIKLGNLGPAFSIAGLNEGNNFKGKANNESFEVAPGTYLLSSGDADSGGLATRFNNISLQEFVAPRQTDTGAMIIYNPAKEISSLQTFTVAVKAINIGGDDKVVLEVRNTANSWKTLPMLRKTPYDYVVDIPADFVLPGLLNYRVIVKTREGFATFPGNHKGDPYAWDNVNTDSWETFLAAPAGQLLIFNAGNDRNKLNIYNPDWRNTSITYVAGSKPGELDMRINIAKPTAGTVAGWQLYVADKIKQRARQVNEFKKLLLNARSTNAEGVKLKVVLITKDAAAFSAIIQLDSTMKEFEIPLDQLKPDSFLLLPRPYPGFLPLTYKPAEQQKFELGNVDKVEVSLLLSAQQNQLVTVQISGVYLK